MKYGKRILAGIMSVLLFISIIPMQEKAMAATEDWRFQVYSDFPLDRVEFHVVDENHGNAIYYVGYRNGKIAIMDENQQLVAQTEYKIIEGNSLYANTYFKGDVALVVRNANGYGMCDLQGRELFPCQYQNISFVESEEGHGIFSLTGKDGKTTTWVDGKYQINHIENPFLLKYEGKVCIFSYDLKNGGRYFYYDLKGKKLGTVASDVLTPVPKNGSWDVDWYKSACEQWLTGKCQEAEEKVATYYESLGYVVDKTASFTGYNYVKERQNQMYYYVIVQSDVSYVTEKEGTVSLGKTNYVFVYKEDQTLYVEGQTNLSKNARMEKNVLMLDVAILAKDGTMQCMDRYTGEMRTLYTTDPNTLFCEKDNYCRMYFETYHLKGVVEEKEYTTNRTQEYVNDTVTYTLDYTKDYLVTIGAEKFIYIMTTGEKINYDWGGEHSLYGVASNEKETQIYYITDKSNPVDKLDVSVEQMNTFSSISYAQSKNNMAWVAYQAKKIYFFNEKHCVSWSFEELGITCNDCVFEGYKMYDNLILFCIKETKYNPTSHTYYSFAVNAENGKAVFLGVSDTVPKLQESKFTACHLTLNSKCYICKNNILYTVNMKNLTIESQDLNNLFGEDKIERFASIEKINGQPYIRYQTPRDESSYFYGYMDLQGNIKIDPLLTKVYQNRYVTRDETKCTQFGEYLFFGDIIFDLEFHQVAKNIRVIYLEEYDDTKGIYAKNGLVSVYNRYEGDQFLGFLYDENTGKIVKKYETLYDVYVDSTSYGNYYAFQLSDDAGIAWVDKNTMEEIGRGNGYCHINEQKKVYAIFEEKKNSKDTVIESSCFYGIKGGVYQITSVKNKTVTFVGTSNTTKKFTIPSTVKIAGKTFRVTGVNADAFSGNTNLTQVVIGKYVTKIGKNAFANCKKLKTIIVKGKKITSVGNNALKGTAKKVTIKVPSEKKKAYTKLWKGKGNANVTIK